MARTVAAYASFPCSYAFHIAGTTLPSPPRPPACRSGSWLCRIGHRTLEAKSDKSTPRSQTGLQLKRSKNVASSASSSRDTSHLGTPIQIVSRLSPPSRWRPPCTDVVSTDDSSHSTCQPPVTPLEIFSGRCCVTTRSRSFRLGSTSPSEPLDNGIGVGAGGRTPVGLASTS